jgi:hypothetical protein
MKLCLIKNGILVVLLTAFILNGHHIQSQIMKVILLLIFPICLYSQIKKKKIFGVLKDEDILKVMVFMAIVNHLLRSWHGEVINYYSFNGILPFSDAASYLSSSISLIWDGETNIVAGRRPLSIMPFVGPMYFFNHNLPLVLIFQTILLCMSLYLVSREVLKSAGPVAAYVYAMVSISAYAQFAPLFMTECYGIIFACTGASFILYALRTNKAKSFIFGMVFLGIAQSIRPGAFVVLPVLFVFFHIKWKRLKLLAVGGICILLILVTNSFFVKSFAPPGVKYIGNIGHTLYGLSVGGHGWKQVYRDHDFKGLTSIETDHKVMELFWEKFSEDPGVLINAYLKKTFEEVLTLGSVFFDICVSIPDIVFYFFISTSLLIIIYCRLKRLPNPWSLAGWIWLGCLPTVPILNDATARAYASVFALIALLVIPPITFILEKLKTAQEPPENDNIVLGKIFAGSLLLLLMTGTGVSVIGKTVDLNFKKSGESSDIVYLNPSSGVEFTNAQSDMNWSTTANPAKQQIFNEHIKLLRNAQTGDTVYYCHSMSKGCFYLLNKSHPINSSGWYKVEMAKQPDGVYFLTGLTKVIP